MCVTVNEGVISSKIKIDGITEISEEIKYPVFDFENKKICNKMNLFYNKTAEKYSVFVRGEFSEKIKRGRVKCGKNVYVGMKYLVCECGENAVETVLDLSFFDGMTDKTRRFTQLWNTADGEILGIGKVLDLNFKNKKQLRDMVFALSEDAVSKNTGKYLPNAILNVKREFCFNNFFMTPGGIAFYFDGGILREAKYGAVCFVVKFEKIENMLKSEFKFLCDSKSANVNNV